VDAVIVSFRGGALRSSCSFSEAQRGTTGLLWMTFSLTVLAPDSRTCPPVSGLGSLPRQAIGAPDPTFASSGDRALVRKKMATYFSLLYGVGGPAAQ